MTKARPWILHIYKGIDVKPMFIFVIAKTVNINMFLTIPRVNMLVTRAELCAYAWVCRMIHTTMGSKSTRKVGSRSQNMRTMVPVITLDCNGGE